MIISKKPSLFLSLLACSSPVWLYLPESRAMTWRSVQKEHRRQHSVLKLSPWKTGLAILLLAIFLVLVVMAVQYESLLNPLIIILSIPFAAIGVAIGLLLNTGKSLSIPVWLGLIMLTGIVVNNAIVLVEQIEIEREKTGRPISSIKKAAFLRLRPILMTTLTTVFGMLPLAIGLGEGSEMLQPLAFVIVWGLSFSLLVSLILVPSLYALFHHQKTAYLQDK